MKALTSEVSLHVFAFELPDGTARVLKIETLDISPFACLEEGFGGVWFEVSVRASLRCLKVPADRVAPALQLTSAEFNRKSASCKLLAPPSATANDAPVAPELFESNPVNSKNENSLTPAWA